MIQTEVENNKVQIENMEIKHKNKTKELETVIDELKLKNEKEINELKDMFIIQQNQLKMQNELLLFQLTNSKKEINKNNQ